ncbi:MAG: hypothetical protein HY392_03425 [Candidatus Diapherotrites archaeon]|nr:hypothetical protein [Candidatus Diapherotrites archaeon]
MAFQEKISQDFRAIKEVLATPAYALGFLALTIILVPLYVILTGMLLLNPIEPNPKIEPINAFLIILIAVLSGLVIVVTLFKLKQNIAGKQSGKTGAVGSFLGLFATACPVCQPIWLIWLGLGSATAFLADYSTLIALAGTLLLLYSLHAAAQAVHKKTCG